MRVFFSNLGCKLNQAELEHLARQFRATGHAIASSLAEADLHVVNSCTVTHVAARDSRKLARRGRRLNPAIRTVLTGCYSTAAPEEAKDLTGVDLIVPNDLKDRLVEHVHQAFPEPGRALGVSGSLPVPFVPLEFGNSRALVKVEDGCNMRCSFCVIPLTRGRQHSRPMDEVVSEVEALGRGGFQEVVITGVQISSYRDGANGLFELVETILAKTVVARIRLTSIAPWQLDHRLLDLFSTGRLCRHFHLSLQSGCAHTLTRMRRPYTPQEYAEQVCVLRERLPGVAITTDLIVGFPGESDGDFDKSLDFCKAMSFARVHAFPFSPRPGTEAATLPEQVPHSVVRERMTRALTVADASERRYWNQNLGTSADVLWESRRQGRWFGTTDNYIRVHTDSDVDLANFLGPARLETITEEGVGCELGSSTPIEPPSLSFAAEDGGPVSLPSS
ncbi:MAG: tRNA (N(6)-L-threonylcarbamoyladenosine(37)-C(2))-methylthiotransferase MtaB [Acidobacteria bacterium]|nr:MAG: tRNA (N(6)-L-threonylcarbamoyladenosine(37)-C(2))-methylthiotransferase MtaB [Acidobacteriota bacterium]